MENKDRVFTRYTEFEKMFGKNLRLVTQKNTRVGNQGDYWKMLDHLRILIPECNIKTVREIQIIMRAHGLTTSLPGLCQVLKALLIYEKKNGNFIFNVYRIDKKLPKFIFAYNNYKQEILNSKDLELKETMKKIFSAFEKKICGRETYRVRNTKGKMVTIETTKVNEMDVFSGISKASLVRIKKRLEEMKDGSVEALNMINYILENSLENKGTVKKF